MFYKAVTCKCKECGSQWSVWAVKVDPNSSEIDRNSMNNDISYCRNCGSRIIEVKDKQRKARLFW